MNQVEDEWSEIQQRFKSEDIDFAALSSEHKLLHLWRWLVDTEINLKNARRMYDKLREQHNEELEDMETYMIKIRELSEKRRLDIENENTQMREQLESVSLILSRTALQGDSVTEKITNLLSDYVKLTEDAKVLSKLKLSNPQGCDLISEIILISTDRESLKQKLAEMDERMQLLQKSSRELELDNEKLAFKLSEAFAELEEKEIRLGELTTVFSGESNHNFNSLIYSKLYDSNKSTSSHLENEPSSETDKTCPIDKKDLTQGYRTESTSSSLILDDMTDYKSASKLSSLMTSCHEMARLEENKKLQSECETLKNRISNLGEKYNNLAVKYIQLKAKKKFQIEDLRGRLDANFCQIESLQIQLSIQRQRLRAEEIFRKQIELDLRKLQDEKRNTIVRLMNSEMEQKENNRELVILQKKISMLDSTNSDLLGQLLKLKYKEHTIPETDDYPFHSIVS